MYGGTKRIYRGTTKPNSSLKVTRRDKAALKIIQLSGFVASFSSIERGGHLSLALGDIFVRSPNSPE